jgi:hypothetical protein
MRTDPVYSVDMGIWLVRIEKNYWTFSGSFIQRFK